jgi:hypothetical protein
LLERLAEKGYLVVATPFSLSFDHLTTCDAVISRFERIAPVLARTYGPLPVVGVGHSCGALLQLLITSLFPDTPRAANALISFNNKPVSEAVPFFEELVAPFFTYAAARNDTMRSSGSEIISVGLQIAKAVVNGRVPPDDLLSQALQLLSPPGARGGFGARSPLDFLTKTRKEREREFMKKGWERERAFASNHAAATARIPGSVRETIERMAGPSVAAMTRSGVLPLLTEAIETLEQIPRLIDEVADGAREFVPSPDKVKAAARRTCKWRAPAVQRRGVRRVCEGNARIARRKETRTNGTHFESSSLFASLAARAPRADRARSTLIMGYDGDTLDESDEIEELLSAAGQVIRMKRPMIQIDVQRRTLPGGHAAPLLAPPLEVASRAETLLGAEAAKDRLLYESADKTVEELIRWLEQSNL